MSEVTKISLVNARNRAQRAENILASAWVDVCENAEFADRIQNLRRELDKLAQDLHKAAQAETL